MLGSIGVPDYILHNVLSNYKFYTWVMDKHALETNVSVPGLSPGDPPPFSQHLVTLQHLNIIHTHTIDTLIYLHLFRQR